MAYALAIMAAIAATSMPRTDRVQVERQVEVMRPVAANLLVYHHAAAAYARTHPAASGPISDASLTTLPSWYRKAGQWSALIGAGRVVATYSNGALPSPMSEHGLAAALAHAGDGDALMGISTGAGQPILPASGSTGAVTPSGVPAGVAVAISFSS